MQFAGVATDYTLPVVFPALYIIRGVFAECAILVERCNPVIYQQRQSLAINRDDGDVYSGYYCAFFVNDLQSMESWICCALPFHRWISTDISVGTLSLP